MFKLNRRYILTHTPSIYLTIAEQEYKQIKENQEEMKIRNEIQNTN